MRAKYSLQIPLPLAQRLGHTPAALDKRVCVCEVALRYIRYLSRMR